MKKLPELEPPFSWCRDSDLVWIGFDLPASSGAFTTRLGGISKEPYSSLNLAISSNDREENVVRNHESISAAIGRPLASFARGHQTHSARVAEVVEPTAQMNARELSDIDGLITTNGDLTLEVFTADCLPLALSAEGAVALLHCGWRGLAVGIVESGVEELIRAAGSTPDSVTAVLGPAIGPCCYEVGAEVIESFRGRGHRFNSEAERLDLVDLATTELLMAGLQDKNIHATQLCTSCHSNLFYSHRRDKGESGRQAALLWLTENRHPLSF